MGGPSPYFSSWRTPLTGRFRSAIGWHPAFRLLGEDSLVEARSRSYSIGEIRNESAGGGALVLEGQGSVEYVSGATTMMTRRSSSVGLRSDFGHVQLWSPAGDGYLCIEPISGLSLSEADKDRGSREKEGDRRAGSREESPLQRYYYVRSGIANLGQTHTLEKGITFREDGPAMVGEGR